MATQRESLPAVTAAGVVALIFACFGILICGVVLLSLLALPHLSRDSSLSAMPEGMRALAAALYLVFLAVCAAEVVVAINVFRRRSWARIAMLVWAGLMVAMCAFGLVGIFLFGEILSKTSPPVPDRARFMIFFQLFLFAIYGVPLAVGIWWLILFTRRRVASAFQSAAASQIPMALDDSGFPAPAIALPPAPKKPAVPLPIAVIAAFDLSGAVWMTLLLFIPLPFQPPFFLFGIQIPQVPYKIFLAVLGVSYSAFVVGIFKLRRWGLDSLLIVKALFLLSGIFTLFNPKFMAAMDDMVVQITRDNPAFPNGQPIFPHHVLEGLLAFSYAFGIVLLIVMLAYRSRFLAAATAKTAN